MRIGGLPAPVPRGKKGDGASKSIFKKDFFIIGAGYESWRAAAKMLPREKMGEGQQKYEKD